MYNLKRYVIGMISILIFAMLPSLSVNAIETETNIEMSCPIELSDFKISKREVVPGDTVEYSFTITDIGIEQYLMNSEVICPSVYKLMEEYGNPPTFFDSDTVYLYWQSPGYSKIVQTFHWSLEDKKNNQLKISGKIPVQKGMYGGEWRLAAIYCDYEGIDFYIREDRENTGVMEEHEEEGCCSTPTLDMSMAKFVVSGTKADLKAPALDLKSLKLSKRTIKNSQKSTFSVKVKDTSKIEKVKCVWIFYEKSNKSKKYGDSLQTFTMKYNKKTKRYQCSVKCPSRLKGKMKLLGIEVRDIYGNEKDYYAYNRYWDDDSLCYEYTSKKNKKYYNAYKNMIVRRK